MLDGDNIFHLVAKVTQCKSRLRIFLNDGFELQLAKHPDVYFFFFFAVVVVVEKASTVQPFFWRTASPLFKTMSDTSFKSLQQTENDI